MIGSLDIGGWQSVFYIFGGVGIIWYPYWYFSAYETPEQHPSITQEELQLIKKSIELIPEYINKSLLILITNVMSILPPFFIPGGPDIYLI